MLFSIIIPCFNSKVFLRKCLDSILSQSFSDFEVIAINDGSTDGTSEILDEYNSKYPFVHVYHFSNSGVSISRKRGITLATGEYIIFVDSDDTIAPNLLFNLHKAIISYKKPDLIRYQSNLINDVANKDHERYNFTTNVEIPCTGLEALKMWSSPGKKYAVYWLFAFKSSIFSKVLFVTTLRCYEDVALIPILIASSNKVVTIDYVGYNYTCNNSTSLTNIRSIKAELSRAEDFYKAYLYAIENFAKLKNVSSIDIAFFVSDYTRRLKGKYDSLPNSLKPNFQHWFK